MMQNKRREIQILLLFLILTAGTIAGSILCAKHPGWGFWENMTFRQGLGILTEQKFYSIAAPLFWLAVTAALGLSATGLPLVPCVLFLRGAAFGAVLERLYLQSTPGEIGKALPLILPYAYCTTFVMLFGAREALRFSMQITGLLCEKNPDEDAVSVRLYVIRFLVLFFFMLLFGMIQNFLLIKFS